MNIYAVTVHHLVHTCPANLEPHAFDTRQQVIHHTPGGPCRTPVTIRAGATTATVACSQHLPSDQQCGACRVAITVTTVNITDLGHQDAKSGHEEPA